jgi:hypothetical protein
MINSAEFFHGILKPHAPEVTLLVEELVRDGQPPGCALEIVTREAANAVHDLFEHDNDRETEYLTNTVRLSAFELALFLLRIGRTSPETIETVAKFAREGAADAVEKFRPTKG